MLAGSSLCPKYFGPHAGARDGTHYMVYRLLCPNHSHALIVASQKVNRRRWGCNKILLMLFNHIANFGFLRESKIRLLDQPVTVVVSLIHKPTE